MIWPMLKRGFYKLKKQKMFSHSIVSRILNFKDEVQSLFLVSKRSVESKVYLLSSTSFLIGSNNFL